jgi:uncharacterized protein YqjF (DUF2071 family)
MGYSRQNAFNGNILQQVGHRPWPMSRRPWVMTQTWHDLLFAHWTIDAAVLQEKVPRQLPLDTFDGRAWIGVVPFYMSNVAPRGIPALPWISAFPELNVRTYVTVDGKPGVYFYSLDAANPIAVQIARRVAHLPYYTASMQVAENGPWIQYSSRRRVAKGTGAQFNGQYRPIAEPQSPVPGTLEYFLTERYCLYTVDRAGRALRLDIHHPPWPLQPAEADITVNTMADAVGIRLPAVPPFLHFARRQDMVAWMPRQV